MTEKELNICPKHIKFLSIQMLIGTIRVIGIGLMWGLFLMERIGFLKGLKEWLLVPVEQSQVLHDGLVRTKCLIQAFPYGMLEEDER
jgi:hypothetical protein